MDVDKKKYALLLPNEWCEDREGYPFETSACALVDERPQVAYSSLWNEYRAEVNECRVLSFCTEMHFGITYKLFLIQDEQIKRWHKGGHGKSVQHSMLGKVKAKLKLKPNVAMLGRYVPTTKVCTVCGQYHDEIKLWDRVFKCDCGVCMDRDVHAARNMVWFYENNVGAGRTDVKRVEMRAMIDDAIRRCSQPESVKREAPVL